MEEVKVIGQMDNTIDHTFESANRVYDIGGVSPTINTCGGGGLQPKIIESVKELGFMDNGTGKHQSNTVYDENALCPNITTIQGGGTQQIKILSANSIRMVRTEQGKALRKQYENHEIRHGFNEYREPELRQDGVTNTLSTVQKDNYICVAMRDRNPTNPSDRTPGIETEQRLEPNTHGTCSTLTSVQKDNLVLEKKNQDICRIEQVGQISSDNSQYGTVLSENGLCSTLQAGTHGYANNCIQTQYRIRKLTPRECWRLMDFSDDDFEKAAEVNSNTQLYKQAGNSIVNNVLVAILGQMIPGKENVYKELSE